MSLLEAERTKLVEDLLRGTQNGDEISLDAIGEAIGARAVSQEDIDTMMSMIEQRGRRVASPEGGHGVAHLKVVIGAARTLRAELGRPPRPEEIAARSGISVVDVQHALALARIIQR